MEKLVRDTDAANWRLLDSQPQVDFEGTVSDQHTPSDSGDGLGLRCCE